MEIEVWEGAKWVSGKLIEESRDGRAHVELASGDRRWVARMHWRGDGDGSDYTER